MPIEKTQVTAQIPTGFHSPTRDREGQVPHLHMAMIPYQLACPFWVAEVSVHRAREVRKGLPRTPGTKYIHLLTTNYLQRFLSKSLPLVMFLGLGLTATLIRHPK